MARAFISAILAACPAANDAVLCVSELATNAVLHSASRNPGGTFTVRAAISDDHVRIEVEDNGGTWDEQPPRDSRPITRPGHRPRTRRGLRHRRQPVNRLGGLGTPGMARGGGEGDPSASKAR